MAAKKGDTVFVHYVGTLEDGTEFDASADREPLEFVLGSGMLIPGFEAAVTGKAVGDKMSITLPPAEAYGDRNDEMVLVVPRDEVPEHIVPEIGMLLQLTVEGGDLDVIISGVSDDEIELDGNHPLAGKTLKFDIEIVEIKAA